MSATLRRRAAAAGAVALVAALAATPAHAQSIADRVARVRDGTVRLSYAVRPGVCGDGRGSISYGDGRWMTRGSGRSVSHGDEWEPGDCEPGPARASLRVNAGVVTRVRVYVGGRWRADADAATDLGAVSAPAAADYLLALAERSDGGVGDDAIFAATLADSAVVWPRLLSIARRESLPSRTRRQATFWLGEAAGNAVAGTREPLDADRATEREVREQAVFALSQRPKGEGVPALLRVARTNGDAEIRRKALFWLGQSGDPRALALFEELLEARRGR
jgi:hypothetical protein